MPNGDEEQQAAEHDQRVIDDWNVLAHFYDSRHGDAGNDWHRNLVLPTTLKLLGDVKGKRGIDLCCGSGVLARQLVNLGAQVTGADQSEAFLSLVEQYDKSADVEWLCFPLAQEVVGMPGQPQKQLNFHRSISHELNLAFNAGLVVDGFAEITKSALEETPIRHTDFFIPPSLEDEIPMLLGLRLRPAPW